MRERPQAPWFAVTQVGVLCLELGGSSQKWGLCLPDGPVDQNQGRNSEGERLGKRLMEGTRPFAPCPHPWQFLCSHSSTWEFSLGTILPSPRRPTDGE